MAKDHLGAAGGSLLLSIGVDTVYVSVRTGRWAWSCVAS